MKICICETPDCESNGVEFLWDDTQTPDDRNTIVTDPWCGGCSVQFTNITTVADQPPEDGT